MIDFILHINERLTGLLCEYDTTIYVILFAIIFVETGLVVMPFLPGDSLLFAAGALCAKSGSPAMLEACPNNPDVGLQIYYVIPLLIIAAVLGDNTNYAIGRFFGQRAVNITLFKRKLVKQKHIDKTHEFFEKYGTKAIIMARFVPIVRTFTPFVAGVGGMSYRSKFLPFDIAGGILWITSMSMAGYLLGTIPWVEEHFEAIVIGIIIISVMPMVIGYFVSRAKEKKAKQGK